jgi:hypothetical protein
MQDKVFKKTVISATHEIKHTNLKKKQIYNKTQTPKINRNIHQQNTKTQKQNNIMPKEEK